MRPTATVTKRKRYRPVTGNKKLNCCKSKRKFAATHNDATTTNLSTKTEITATNFADASGRGADEARMGASEGHSRGRERSSGDPRG
jgi:hypothetical protein